MHATFEAPVKFPPYTRLPMTTDKKPHKPPVQALSTAALAREYKVSGPNMEAKLRALGLEPVAENVMGNRTFRLWNVEQVRERMSWYETLSRAEKLALHREAADSSEPLSALTSEVKEMKELLVRIADAMEKGQHKKERKENPED